MRLIDPDFEVLTKDCPRSMLQRIEDAGRICYKSESRGDPETFVRSLIRRGHHSVLEHVSVSVSLTIDRGVSHELVRHRLASYSQMSTRYCDASRDGDIEFIRPHWLGSARWDRMEPLLRALGDAEASYKELRQMGFPPQDARAVLPNCLRTDIIMTANVRQWRHILKLRTSPAAHPDMRHIMLLVLEEFQARYPVLFENIGKASCLN